MASMRSVSPYHRNVVTGVAYLVASALAVALTRFGGGAAFIWIANAVLLASLTTCRQARWPTLVAICWSGGVVAAGLWGLGWAAAPWIAATNAIEPVIAALLVTHWRVHRASLDSPRNLAVFVLAAGAIAPIVSGLVGAFVVDRATGTGFANNYLHWTIGHALGAVTFTPIFAQIAGGEAVRWWRETQWRDIGEGAGLLVLVAATAAAVFAQSRLPLLFLPALPLMLITFRIGRIGAAIAIVTITAISVALTLKGYGPVNMIQSGLGERLQFLQLYLAATVLTILPVAADLTRRNRLYDRLCDSEARFRLLTENSSDIVLSLDTAGAIRYASPSIGLLGGYDPDQLVGRPAADLVFEDDRDGVRAVHVQALRHPGRTFTVEYRAIVSGDAERWFETHTRAVTDEDGAVCGVVSAVRETSRRRSNEVELSRVAHTDALTSVCNRRAFDRELSERLSRSGGGHTGCVAIFDLDHFKQINDRFGHATGDEVLRAFATTAGARVREGDMLARIGGEEFGIIFAGLSAATAQAVCERIREAVSLATVRSGDWPVRATVSVGIAGFDHDDSPATVVARADAALYRAKENGRNRSLLAA